LACAQAEPVVALSAATVTVAAIINLLSFIRSISC